MSAGPNEIGRRMKACLSEIEALRAERQALHGVSYPDIPAEPRPQRSPEEWERRAKIALLRVKIMALEAEYTALRLKKVAAELDAHLEREVGRAKVEPGPGMRSYILGSAGSHIQTELENASEAARRKLRKVRIRYMTEAERLRHESRQRKRQRDRRREHEQEHGYER